MTPEISELVRELQDFVAAAPHDYPGHNVALFERAISGLQRLSERIDVGWQPIETAPLTGDDVLLFRVSPTGRPLPPLVAGWFDNGETSGWSIYDDPNHWVRDKITHWQPLPVAPANSATKEKPRPADCPDILGCGWHHVKTEPEIWLYVCSRYGCRHGIQAASSAPVSSPVTEKTDG